jgi:hypothetical protein
MRRRPASLTDPQPNLGYRSYPDFTHTQNVPIIRGVVCATERAVIADTLGGNRAAAARRRGIRSRNAESEAKRLGPALSWGNVNARSPHRDASECRGNLA